jgi:4-hydroxysphinganine ceramide fatty acyl 2-hydroxylase
MGINILYFIIFPIFRLLPEPLVAIMTGGMVTGYVLYDMIHYFLHHISPKTAYWKDLKLYHMYHHYKNGTAGYGVSQKFWDIVFDTEIKY